MLNKIEILIVKIILIINKYILKKHPEISNVYYDDNISTEIKKIYNINKDILQIYIYQDFCKIDLEEKCKKKLTSLTKNTYEENCKKNIISLTKNTYHDLKNNIFYIFM